MAIRRCALMVLPVIGLCLCGGAAGAGEEKNPYDELDELREQHKKELGELRDQYTAEKQEKIDKQAARHAAKEREEKALKTDTVVVDDKELDVNEPPTPQQAIGKPADAKINIFWRSPEDFDILKHKVWTLKKEDFRHMKPTEVLVEFEHLTDRKYFVVAFTVTNSTNEPRRIAPRLWVVTSDLRFTPEIGGLIVHKAVERSMLRDFKSVRDLAGYVVKDSGTVEEVGYFAAGETRSGLAVFPRFDPEMDEMKIIVDGLDNDMKYDKGLRRSLVLNFARPGDEFYPQRESLVFTGKEFEWIWNWRQEFDIDTPSRMVLDRPSGQGSRNLWYYRYTLRNRSGSPREIDLRSVGTAVTVAVNLSVTRTTRRLDPADDRKVIEKSFTKEFSGRVEAVLVDDGESTIYKAQLMRAIGAEFKPDRFLKGTLADGGIAEGLVIFDEEDVDFEPVFAYVENRLNAQGFESTLENPQKLEDLYVKSRPPVIDLTDEEKQKIREQVLAAVPAAFEKEQAEKRIVADVTARAGIASGTFRVRRSYVKRGEIDDGWLHEWEEEDL